MRYGLLVVWYSVRSFQELSKHTGEVCGEHKAAGEQGPYYPLEPDAVANGTLCGELQAQARACDRGGRVIINA